MGESESESERQCCPFTRKCSKGEWENKNLLPPPQKITATEKLFYISVCSRGFNLLTCSNDSFSKLIYVWQLHISKMFPLTGQHSCLQAGREEYDMFRRNVNQSFGQTFRENVSATPCAHWFSLIAVGPRFLSPLEEGQKCWPQKGFLPVSQGFCFVPIGGLFKNCVLFTWAVHNTTVSLWEVLTSSMVLRCDLQSSAFQKGVRVFVGHTQCPMGWSLHR